MVARSMASNVYTQVHKRLKKPSIRALTQKAQHQGTDTILLQLLLSLLRQHQLNDAQGQKQSSIMPDRVPSATSWAECVMPVWAQVANGHQGVCECMQLQQLCSHLWGWVTPRVLLRWVAALLWWVTALLRGVPLQ